MKEKFYVTNYALTKGILCMTGEVDASRQDVLISGFQFFHKNEWFRTKEEAVARVEAMRQEKIESINRQLAKLTKMDVTKVTDTTTD
jgi:hypothetical protein